MSKTKRRTTCCLRQLQLGPFPSTDFQLSPSDTDIVTQYRLQKAKSEINSAQKNAKANIDFIIQELQTLSVEIEDLKKAIKDLEALISHTKCKTVHPKKLSDLCKVKSSLRIDLSNVLQLEQRMKRQLHEARIAYRNAKLDDHLVNEDIKKFKNKSWDNHAFEKSLMEQQRIEREIQSKKNAISAREDTITSVANSITAHVLQKLPGEHNLTQKRFREAKSARESVSKYLEKSFRVARETKAVALTEAQIRQRRQAENLLRLKRELNDIHKSLAVKSHLRRIHDEEIAIEKEEVKSLLRIQGTNPYLAEYLLAIEEKQRELQRKMLIEEQKRLMDMQREYSAIETSKAKQERDKNKWARYWARKTLDRLMQQKKSQLEMYFDVSGDEEEKETIKTQLQEKVAEQIHQRMSHAQSQLNVLSQIRDDDDEEEEEEETAPQKFQSVDLSSRGSKVPVNDLVQEKASENFKPYRQSAATKRISNAFTISVKNILKGTSNLEVVEASLRKASQLQETQRESLLRMAGAGENTTLILLNGRNNNFEFGYVPVGQRKYIMVNVANIGVNLVQLKMSILNPFGPFQFCNSLKQIPPDGYFTLKFKYQPTEGDEEAQETVKIEEIGKPENCIIIKLKGYSLGFMAEE